MEKKRIQTIERESFRARKLTPEHENRKCFSRIGL